MKIQAAKSVRGRISVPGDKSISHRAAIIASLAAGTSTLSNFSTSADCVSTLECLRNLGVQITVLHDRLRVNGLGLARYSKPPVSLDCGNSGTTMRMLTGALAGQSLTSTLIGDHSLSKRPMDRLIEPLELMGATISSNQGRPPLIVTGSAELRAIDYTLPVASAQVKSAVLFAGLHAHGSTSVTEPQPTRDHTERMLQFFGAKIQSEPRDEEGSVKISISGREGVSAREVSVPGDISSAAFFIAAAILLQDSAVEISNVGLNPTRTQFLSVLQSLGLNVCYEVEREESNEPVGWILVKSGQLTTRTMNEIPTELVPRLIDELPILGVIGATIPGGISVRGASELRVKETDRIAATVSNLRAMGVEVEEFLDGFEVPGSQVLRGAQLESYGDHRIAMAFAVAALAATEECELSDADCVCVSFPEFFKTLETLVLR
ncbi:MAG TPA: 3-phosphoshikimate 1-carboxyvinyltransferase [Pyrinomonadaceae bacterium]|nr:3-phosphoshikimate 1-carboxyvinyltransferase [Pyrinomonadaceae bacterium]